LAPKYVAFFVFIFVCGTILGLVIEQGTVAAGQQSTLNSLLLWQQVGSEEAWGPLDIVALVPGYFAALFKAAVWDFAFLTGGWIYVKWLVWAPLMAMFVWGLVLTFLALFQKILS